mmetsp:Transcript_925/g.1700  ORF Transcript_925/g.1700 Transcript_925/m.1700 type:complete len:258 (+) Transcript_925:193-966(+)
MRGFGRVGERRREGETLRHHQIAAGGVAGNVGREVRRQDRRHIRPRTRQNGPRGGLVPTFQIGRGGDGRDLPGRKIGCQIRAQGSHASSNVRKGQDGRHAHRRPPARRGTYHLLRSRPIPPRPRLGPLHPRRNPGGGHHHPRRLGDEAEDRSHLRHGGEAILPPVHFSAQLRRRDGEGGHARPEGGGARQPRRTGASARHTVGGGIPVRDTRRVARHREQRLVVDGVRVRRVSVAHGRGGTHQESHRGYCHGNAPGR